MESKLALTSIVGSLVCIANSILRSVPDLCYRLLPRVARFCFKKDGFSTFSNEHRHETSDVASGRRPLQSIRDSLPFGGVRQFFNDDEPRACIIARMQLGVDCPSKGVGVVRNHAHAAKGSA